MASFLNPFNYDYTEVGGNTSPDLYLCAFLFFSRSKNNKLQLDRDPIFLKQVVSRNGMRLT